MLRMHRRHFIKRAGLSLGALAVAASGDLVANPYGKPIGLQLYTVRGHIQTDLEGTLKRIAEIGYKEVELGTFDFYGKKPAELRRILERSGLKGVGLHFNEEQLRSGPEKHIADAKECGVTYVGLSSLCVLLTGSRSSLLGLMTWFLILIWGTKYRFRALFALAVLAPLTFAALPGANPQSGLSVIRSGGR